MNSRIRFLTAFAVVILILGICHTDILGQIAPPLNELRGQTYTPKPSDNLPYIDYAIHHINKMRLAVTNNGYFGIGYSDGHPVDPETGRHAFSCEYPANSRAEYLWSAELWFGAVIGRDTLVSTGVSSGAGMYYICKELWPDNNESSLIQHRSIHRKSLHFHPEAVSEEDYITHFTDTVTNSGLVRMDAIDNRPHKPLNIDVAQRSYGWSYGYAEDFIILDYTLKNIGPYPLKKLYIGIIVEPMIFQASRVGVTSTWLDDICGFKKTAPSPFWHGHEDSIMVAWAADNDGDPSFRSYHKYDFTSSTSVTGIKVINTPSDSINYSFNWWVTDYNGTVDWGPRQVSPDKPFRDFGQTFGTPIGDRDIYYMLSNSEFDYDQLECAIQHTGNYWLRPPVNADNFADGHNPVYMLSFGPFDVEPGDTLPFTIAYIAGENFHHNPLNMWEAFNPYNPYPYMDQLDFSDLTLNAIWADWVYDNPGYDTDRDGDSGLAKWFYNAYNTDSVYKFYRGDGVPDFRGAAPPPSPRLNIIPDYGRLIVRWNGDLSENFIDVFSGEKDFEGYKIHFGEDNRVTDFIQIATYDKRDFNRYQWLPDRRTWEISPIPLDYDTLILIYGNNFIPESYTIDNPLEPDDARNSDHLYTYFEPQGWNESDLSNPFGIHKAYPDADHDDPSDTTEDGFRRYYEYEYIIDNLAPTREVYVSVTAFDYGSRSHKLSPLESSLYLNDTPAFPLPSTERVENELLGVIVYPNPYRIDGGYATAGYENRDRTLSAERARGVNFANLPRICTIRIFTLTGDLVKEIKHYAPDGGPQAQHEKWNMISRNTQTITTGLYIWSVTSDMGEQLGKLVIMK